MDNKLFVPADFSVPDMLETDQFRLRMLSVADVEKDYEAVMESSDLLHAMGGTWPRDGFTIEENLADLEFHQREFYERKSFAYTVVALDESRILGCVYINPPKTGSADAEIKMWVRQSEFDKGLDPVLFSAVRGWIVSSWPFTSPSYIGRE